MLSERLSGRDGALRRPRVILANTDGAARRPYHLNYGSTT